MFRTLAVLTVLAAGLLGSSLIVTGEPGQLSLFGGRNGLPQVDYYSFILGLAAGVAATSVARFPWGEIPQRIIAAIAGWRRNFVLASLAACCMTVLLFY